MTINPQISLTDHSWDDTWRGREKDAWLVTTTRRKNKCHEAQDGTHEPNRLARANRPERAIARVFWVVRPEQETKDARKTKRYRVYPDG